jgi:hypothetical protein
MPHIYYTGMGSKKSGKHTEKEFLRIMKKEVNQSCTIHKTRASFPACMKEKDMMKRMETPKYRSALKKCLKETLKARNRKSSVNKACVEVEKAQVVFDKKYGKTRKQLSKKCLNETLKNNQEPCTLEEYIKYSGAKRLTRSA